MCSAAALEKLSHAEGFLNEHFTNGAVDHRDADFDGVCMVEEGCTWVYMHFNPTVFSGPQVGETVYHGTKPESASKILASKALLHRGKAILCVLYQQK